MKRTKLKDRVLPTYTKGEEIFNIRSNNNNTCYCNWGNSPQWIWDCKWYHIRNINDIFIHNVKHISWA